MADSFTPLPADLPENWASGQIVSPNGTDVGLTKQHGYNYLNKAINDAQKEINRLSVGSGVPIVSAEGDGTFYTAQIDGLNELKEGMLLVIIPNVGNTTILPKLNVNNFGDQPIYVPLSGSTNTYTTGRAAGDKWMAAQRPLLLQLFSYGWLAVSLTIPNASTIEGIVAVANGGTGRSSLIGSDYSTYRVRESALLSDVPLTVQSGQIAFVYK